MSCEKCSHFNLKIMFEIHSVVLLMLLFYIWQKKMAKALKNMLVNMSFTTCANLQPKYIKGVTLFIHTSIYNLLFF